MISLHGVRKRVTGTGSFETKKSIMNIFEKSLAAKGEAKLRYLDGEFQVVTPGDFVTCAVSGDPIPLDQLRYWSVELQEPYASAQISLDRYCEKFRS